MMAIVLAGGQGKRMKSKLYKVLHPVCGKPMIGHIIDVLEKLNTQRTVVVVGHGAEAVRSYLGSRVEYALQEEQLGTGHAVLQAQSLLADLDGMTIVMCGDTPLVTARSLEQLCELHQQHGAAATVLTARMEQPQGYGRIIRDEQGEVLRIVEDKDCTPLERNINEINTGTFCFHNRKLFQALKKVTNHNVQQEYYLTDVLTILSEQGELLAGYCIEDAREAVGINDRVLLSEAERLMRDRINHQHMLNGVTIVDPSSTYIDSDVSIEEDTTIHPGCRLRGLTTIGTNCVIGPDSDIADSKIGDDVVVQRSVLNETTVGARTVIGPFAYLRPGAHLGEDVKVGDFVEIKNASLGDGTKVSHLSYVGDAKVGRGVNIGCGAITVNYDGQHKHLTEIEDGAFVGSNVNLIAPVKIGKDAYVVAGSTITHQVNDRDVAIARERQTNKPGYADILRNRIRSKGSDA